MGKWTRRAFIGAGSLAGGGLVLGVVGAAIAPSRHSLVPDDADGTGRLNTWITVSPDNVVTILVPHCEMGQGAQQALAMMAAEEMDADWSLVRVAEAPALDDYANGYVARVAAGDGVPGPLTRGFEYGTYRIVRWVGLQPTGGSMSVRTTGRYGMTVAGAAARQMLVGAAAARFGVPEGELAVRRSVVTHAPSNRSATFGELAVEAARRSVPSRPALKTREAYTLRRTSPPRPDLPAKVTGRAVYGIDVTRARHALRRGRDRAGPGRQAHRRRPGAGRGDARGQAGRAAGGGGRRRRRELLAGAAGPWRR